MSAEQRTKQGLSLVHSYNVGPVYHFRIPPPPRTWDYRIFIEQELLQMLHLLY